VNSGELPEHIRDFLNTHHVAAMITVGADGWAKVAKMEPAIVNGRLWSVGHRHKVRTRRLGRDPKATLFYDAPGAQWLAVEAIVDILDGPTTPRDIVEFMRVRQGRPRGPLAWHGDNGVEVELNEGEFMNTMSAEGCLIYQFDICKTYGNIAEA
jgi:Pyridoxamine 5'-phosphate oxidase